MSRHPPPGRLPPSHPLLDAPADRLRRALNAVRDAQEMLERLVRTGPAALRSSLADTLEDLEWTAGALVTAQQALEEPGLPQSG